jgi:hypothetical protein
MAIGLPVQTYPEETGLITGKKLRVVSPQEVEKFNDDLVNIAAQYGMDAIRSAVEEYQNEIFTMVRQVMQEANAPYGGSGALGDEVCMRALRPIDVGIAADIWDTDYTAVVVGTAAQREQTLINADAMGEEEGNIIFGALVEHGDNRVVNAYRWSKNQKNYPTLTLPFTYCDADRAQFVKFQAPIIQFTEETLSLYVNVVRAQYSYLALVGIHATKASSVATTYV